MRDLIDRQAAIDALNRYYSDKKYIARSRTILSAICLDIKHTLRDLPAANRWIPCKEQLPEEREWIGTKKFGTTISDTVLITFNVGGARFVKPLSLQNGELSRADKRSMDVVFPGWEMVAWQPLPEPYKEEEE